MASLAAVVPAAGQSSRFGSQKLLAEIAGQPLVARTLQSLLDAGISRVVVVVAPGHQVGALVCMRAAGVEVVTNPDPARGMFSSIREGLAHVDADIVAVLPADMPYVSPATVSHLLTAAHARQRVVVPSYGDRRGHPILIPSRYRLPLVAASAERTLKEALLEAAGQPPDEIKVDDPGVLRDVDVPSDLH